jgi:hypothetical protein
MSSNRSVKSKYTGVFYHKKFKKFYSHVTFKGIVYNCGFSDSAQHAAKLRDLTIIRIGAPMSSLQILKPVP